MLVKLVQMENILGRKLIRNCSGKRIYMTLPVNYPAALALSIELKVFFLHLCLKCCISLHNFSIQVAIEDSSSGTIK